MARVEGLAVFVAGAIRGETVRVKIEHLGHTAAYGRILQVLEPSAHRVAPDCPQAGACGGCVFWHMDYEEELYAKARRVTDALNRIGGQSLELVPIVPSPRETGYRNKAQYPVALVHGKATAGFFRPRTHQVLDVGRCRIQGSAADRAKDTVVRWMRDNRVAPLRREDPPGPGAPYLRPHGLDHRPGAGVPGGERRRHSTGNGAC